MMRMRFIVAGLIVCNLMLVTPMLRGQEAADPDAVPTSVRPRIDIPVEIPPAARASSSFDVDAATQAYVELLSEEQRAQSSAYTNGGYWLQLWGFLYGLGVAALLLMTRLSARMRDLGERLSRRRPIQTAIYGLQYIVASAVLGFPLTLYQSFIREHQYEMATQSFGLWMGDQLKGLGVGLVLGTLAIMTVYGVIRRFPRTWWMWGGLVGVAFLTFVILITPVFINPLFNDYEPLEEGSLRDRILSMARANGIPADNVYWYDASRQTNRINANVSGLFGTLRISLNDNLLEHTSPEEIEAVMAHEMGHYLFHLPKLLIYTGLIVIVGFAFMKWGSAWALRRWGDRWGLRSISDVAGLPLLVAIFSIYSFVATPVQYSVVRHSETEADIFALNASQQPDGFARVSMRISSYRKISPSPLEEALLHHHPSGRTRVQRAMQWKSEHLDEERRKGR